MGSLYLSDLRNRIQADIIAKIRKERPVLIEAINKGEEIEIGTIEEWEVKKFKIV